MKKRFLKRIRTVLLLAAAWAAVFAANSALHRRAYEQLLAGETPAAMSRLYFVIPFEPVFFIHRGAMGRKELARAFRETGSLISSRQAWTLKTPGPVMSSPAGAGGAVYVGNNGDQLLKIDAEKHEIIWKYETGGDVETRPLVAPNGKVYVAAHDGLHAVDAETGEGRLLHAIRWAESSPAYATGVIFVGTDDLRMLALDAESGDVKWSFRAAGPVESSPAVSGGRVFFGCNKGELYSLNAETGEKEWQKKVGGRIEGRPLVMNGTVYTGTTEEKVHAFDAGTGALRWERNLGGSIVSSAAGEGDIVVVGTLGGQVFGLGTNDGSVKWTFKNAGPVEADPAIHDGVVYVGTHYGFLHAFNLKTGKRLWSFLAGWDIDESSPLIHEGRAYFGAMDGRIYSLNI
ncbi:PQQ-binding-like beta-propeller repeat protein [bacterium]